MPRHCPSLRKRETPFRTGLRLLRRKEALASGKLT
jgi:hypothetical protein